MVRVLGLTIALLIAASPSVARAGDGLEFVPFVGHRQGGSILNPISLVPRALDERQNWGFSLTSTSTDSTRYEFLYAHQGTRLTDTADPRDAFDLDVHYLHLGGTVDLPHEELVPFFSGGIDMAHMSPGRPGYGEETRLSLSLGGGLKWNPSDRFGIALSCVDTAPWPIPVKGCFATAAVAVSCRVISFPSSKPTWG